MHVRSLPKKLSLDFVMSTLILVEFAYQLTGSAVHEWLGLSMFLLFLLHGGLNWKWFGALFKGRYNGLRSVMLVINAGVFISALLMVVSGVLNSELLFSLSHVELDLLSRPFHTAAAHWFLVFTGIHLGLHWKMVMTEGRCLAGLYKHSRLRTLALHAMTVVIVATGIYASCDRGLLSKMVAYYSFDDWNFDESVAGFFIQYLTIMGLYACLANYALQAFKGYKSPFARSFFWLLRSTCDGFCRRYCTTSMREQAD